jgi:hypothetical protein
MESSNIRIRVLRRDELPPRDVGILGYDTPEEALAAGERTCLAGNLFTAYLADSRGRRTQDTVCVGEDGLYYPAFFDVPTPSWLNK